MRAKLTKRTVDATKATEGGRKVMVWDTDLRGFGLIAHPPSAKSPSGQKVYVVRYHHHGRDRRMTLGPHGQLTPDQARRLAADRLAEVRNGRDPLAEREEARKAHARDPQTVAWLFERYLEAKSAPDAKPRPWKPATESEVRRLYAKEIKGSALAKRPLREVATRDVETLHRSYMRREKPSPYTANRVLSWLSGAFRFALAEGYRDDGVNPCNGVTRFEEQERDRAFTLRELAKLGEAMDEVVSKAGASLSPEREKRAKRQKAAAETARDALRLLALTGLRRSNVLGLRWREVDFDERLLALEDTKAGRKLKALGSEALELLARRRKAAGKGAEYVFPSTRTDGSLRDIRGYTHEVYREAGFRSETAEKRAKREKGVTEHHVWRHTFASHAAECGFSELVIGHMLGHAARSVTSKYVRLDEIVRTAEERTQERIAAALDRKKPAEVVSLSSRGESAS